MNELTHNLKKEFVDKEYAHTYADEFLNLKIATQLKVLREQRNWTQEELAQNAYMKQSRVCLLENVNYSSWSINTLRKLARAFDVTLDVDFRTFNDRIRDIETIDRQTLERMSREEDLYPKESELDLVANGASEEGLRPFLNGDKKIPDIRYWQEQKLARTQEQKKEADTITDLKSVPSPSQQAERNGMRPRQVMAS